MLVSASYNNIFEGKTGYLCREFLLEKRFVRRPSSVEAARKVSPDWSQETMTCHCSNCFSIV